jgi:hypothetical protein
MDFPTALEKLLNYFKTLRQEKTFLPAEFTHPEFFPQFNLASGGARYSVKRHFILLPSAFTFKINFMALSHNMWVMVRPFDELTANSSP